jgi:hypothetical protein
MKFRTGLKNSENGTVAEICSVVTKLRERGYLIKHCSLKLQAQQLGRAFNALVTNGTGTKIPGGGIQVGGRGGDRSFP